jgi:hypothetical protein
MRLRGGNDSVVDTDGTSHGRVESSRGILEEFVGFCRSPVLIPESPILWKRVVVGGEQVFQGKG